MTWLGGLANTVFTGLMKILPRTAGKSITTALKSGIFVTIAERFTFGVFAKKNKGDRK